MANQVSQPIEQLKHYKKKRNKILFFTLIPPVVFLILWAFFNFVLNINPDILLSIYIPLIIGYLVYVNLLRGKLSYYSMYYDYYHMLTYQEGIQKVNGKLYTKSWLSQFETDGYTKTLETNDYIVYLQFLTKLKNVSKSGHVMNVVVVAKHKDVDFYNEELQKHVEEKLREYDEHDKVSKHLFFQFKRYEKIDDHAKNEINQIVNYKHNNQHLIHINIGYSNEQGMAYFLCPIKRYPSKYYYYSCQQIKKYSKIRVNDN